MSFLQRASQNIFKAQVVGFGRSVQIPEPRKESFMDRIISRRQRKPPLPEDERPELTKFQKYVLATGLSIGAWEILFWGAAMHGSIFILKLFFDELPPMDSETMSILMNQSMAFRNVYLDDHPNFIVWRWIIAATTAPIITANFLDRIFKTKVEDE